MGEHGNIIRGGNPYEYLKNMPPTNYVEGRRERNSGKVNRGTKKITIGGAGGVVNVVGYYTSNSVEFLGNELLSSCFLLLASCFFVNFTGWWRC